LSGVATLTSASCERLRARAPKFWIRARPRQVFARSKSTRSRRWRRNHRKDLGEAVLIKENHIRLAGGVSAALQRRKPPRAEPLDRNRVTIWRIAVRFRVRADVILLDNMNPAWYVRRRAGENARSGAKNSHGSFGGITLGNVREFAEAGVD